MERLIPYEWPFISHTIALSRDMKYDLPGEVIGVKKVENKSAHNIKMVALNIRLHHDGGLRSRITWIFITIVALAFWFFGSSARAPPAPWGLTDRALLALSLLILSQRIRSSSG